MPVALPATSKTISEISRSTLVHVTNKSNIDKIVVDKNPRSSNIGENCTVNIIGGQGWSVAPFKLFRDYSILDIEITNLKNWGRYTYFFLGEPNRWAIIKNLSSLKNWDGLKEDFAIIKIEGAQLLSKSGQPIFYRPDDDVIVSRGGYSGPALVIS